MISLHQIISQAITSFKNLDFEEIGEAEIVDMTNDIAMDIAEETDYYIRRYSSVPKSDATDPDTNILTMPFTDATNQVDMSAYSILQVIRGRDKMVPCHEYSYQAVRTQMTDNYPFPRRGKLDKYSYHASFDIDTGDMLLYFGGNFELNELAVVTYTTNKPFGDPIYGNDPNSLTKLPKSATLQLSIPDFMRNAFRYGLIFRMAETLYYKGNDSLTWRMKEADNRYKHHLLKAKSYIMSYKNKGHGIKTSTINWFDENEN